MYPNSGEKEDSRQDIAAAPYLTAGQTMKNYLMYSLPRLRKPRKRQFGLSQVFQKKCLISPITDATGKTTRSIKSSLENKMNT